MNAAAQAAIDWTRGRLGAAQRQFLADLPLTHEEDDRLYVHSEASNPPRWRYVQSTADAARSMCRDAGAGHILRPYPSPGALFDVGDRQDDELCADHRALACNCSRGGNGWRCSVRSANPATAIRRPVSATYDTEKREITYCRVAYDVETAAKRIRANGLPLWLADRLSQGR